MLIREKNDLKILCNFSKNILEKEKEKIKIEANKKSLKRKNKVN